MKSETPNKKMRVSRYSTAQASPGGYDADNYRTQDPSQFYQSVNGLNNGRL